MILKQSPCRYPDMTIGSLSTSILIAAHKMYSVDFTIIHTFPNNSLFLIFLPHSGQYVAIIAASNGTTA